uniref:Ppx/GppA phosphatase family protein n=1 Tax=Brevundimonas abyssalis TaxID=1125965 RepID=UPI0035A25C74
MPEADGARGKRGARSPSGREAPLYAALDLGTNNCRLLIARPSRDGFRVVDSFSRIVRLGEGLTRTGRLDPGAMDRAYDALNICAERIARREIKATGSAPWPPRPVARPTTGPSSWTASARAPV